MSDRCRPARCSALLLAICLVAVAAAGCQTPAPALDISQVRWATYRNPVLGYSLNYPDVYAVRADGSGVMFQYGPGAPVLVRYADETEGRQRGLWFGAQPVGPIDLAGAPGLEYVYTHYDGPIGDRTIAYVIPYGGRFLGLEFRAAGDLDAVQQRILQSFTLAAQTSRPDVSSGSGSRAGAGRENASGA